MRDLPIVCPAASLLNPAIGAQSVLCGELDLANDGAEIDGFTDRGQVSPVMHGDHDRRVLGTYCCGPGVTGAVNSYAACPIWQAAKEAYWARRRGAGALRDEQAIRPPAIRDELLAGV